MRLRSTKWLAHVLLGVAVAGCGGATSEAPAVGNGLPFNIAGNPEAPTGATWTYHGVVDGTTYDLTGVLYKPAGSGPFPAVVLSHGDDGSAAFLAALLAPTMVHWGLVCIAVNYTHATGVPVGAPGDTTQVGASQPNVLRGHMAHELLRQLGYVDMTRVALHGHSMGAYVNVALAGAYPNDFRVASQTGGGVRPAFIVVGPAPSPAQASGIRTPFQLHHGALDTTVPLSYDMRFDSLLTAMSVAHELYVYPSEDHLAVRTDSLMLERVHAWYTAAGMFTP
jgi:dienelactone hydrolase